MWKDRVLTCTVKTSSRVLVQEQEELLVRFLPVLPRISKSHVLECFYWVSYNVEVIASALFDLFNQLNKASCVFLFQQVKGIVFLRASVNFNTILRAIA